ncbi:MAG: FlgO family outer membrane protein [Smithellaceae bacterium]|nr:FlgO family outer membrane protein [Smithellaceae bacterium]
MKKQRLAIIFFLLSFILSGSSVLGAETKATVAVIDFETIGTEDYLGRAVAEIMRTELIDTGKYRVVERSQINRVISEQSFQKSGIIDERSATEIGKLLGADLIIIGSVVKLGNAYTINARMIDLKTGEATLGKNVTGTDLNMLTDMTRNLIDSLFQTNRSTVKSGKETYGTYSPPKPIDTYGKILFFDNFSSAKNGWPVYENQPYYDTYFRDGRYFMETKNEKKSLEVIDLPADLPDNFDVELTSSWQSGVTDSAYGLILGRDRNTYYVFGVSGNGQSVIWVTEDDIPRDDAMPWRAGTAKVSDGKYVENTQKVEVRGSSLSYHVNGTFLTTIHGSIPLKVVGVCVSRQQKVAFHMLKITQR